MYANYVFCLGRMDSIDDDTLVIDVSPEEVSELLGEGELCLGRDAPIVVVGEGKCELNEEGINVGKEEKKRRRAGFATDKKRRNRRNRWLRRQEELTKAEHGSPKHVSPSKETFSPDVQSIRSESDSNSASLLLTEEAHNLESGDNGEVSPEDGTEEVPILVDSHCHWDRMILSDQWKHITEGTASPSDILTVESYVHNDNIAYKPPMTSILEYMVAVFCDPPTWWMIPNAVSDPRVYFTVGIHPQHCGKRVPSVAELEKLGRLLEHHRCIGFGEIGLDAHHAQSAGAQEQQMSVLGQLLDMYSQVNKPLVLHCRSEGACDPFDSLLQLCRQKIHWDSRVHFHSFSGNASQAWEWLDSFPRTKFGFGGAITRPGPTRDRAWQVLQILTLDRILLETDAPYQLPVGCKHPNHPWNLIFVAQEVLRARPEIGSLKAVAAFTRMNARSLYQLW